MWNDETTAGAKIPVSERSAAILACDTFCKSRTKLALDLIDDFLT